MVMIQNIIYPSQHMLSDLLSPLGDNNNLNKTTFQSNQSEVLCQPEGEWDKIGIFSNFSFLGLFLKRNMIQV
jgi:hypothetical protein